MKFIPVSNYDEIKWKIGMDNIDWAENHNSCGCSYNVLGSRLLNMTYPNYLRYLRANGAELCGKTGLCVVLVYISLETNVEHLVLTGQLHVLFCFVLFFLENCLVKSFAHFETELSFYC